MFIVAVICVQCTYILHVCLFIFFLVLLQADLRFNLCIYSMACVQASANASIRFMELCFVWFHVYVVMVVVVAEQQTRTNERASDQTNIQTFAYTNTITDD